MGLREGGRSVTGLGHLAKPYDMPGCELQGYRCL